MEETFIDAMLRLVPYLGRAPWSKVGVDIKDPEGYLIAERVDREDAEFICFARNHAKAVMDLVIDVGVLLRLLDKDGDINETVAALKKNSFKLGGFR